MVPPIAIPPAQPRKTPHVMDQSVTSSTDESNQNISSQPVGSSEDVVASQNTTENHSLVMNSEGVVASQPHLSQESRDPNTQRVLQENRRRPAPKSVKRQRDIEAAAALNGGREEAWLKRVRIMEEQHAAKTAERINNSRSRAVTSQSFDPPTVRDITGNSPSNSPQSERSYDQRILTQPSQSEMSPPNVPPARQTDDANGHSNSAAPRRINIIHSPSPPPPPLSTFHPRKGGKLPGG